MALALITIRLLVDTDDRAETAEAVGYLLDGGAIQDAVTGYATDRGFATAVRRSWHDVELSDADDVDMTDAGKRAGNARREGSK